MKRKPLFKCLSIVFVLVLFCSCFLPASAINLGQTAQQKLGISNAYPNGIFASMNTIIYADEVIPIRSTQAEHKAGATTTLAVSSTVTEESYASASLGYASTTELGVEVAGLASAKFSGTLSSELQIGNSVSYTVGTTVSYTLMEDTEPGLYRMTIVFPRRTVMKKVYGVNSSGTSTTLWQERITYAPRIYDAHWSWEKYELGT